MRKYIAFEGLDLSGKTTIINNIKLKRSEYIYTKEPGGFNNDLSLKIRDLILNYKDEIDPIVETYLFAASRAIDMKETKKYLEDDKVVISDEDITYLQETVSKVLDLIKALQLIDIMSGDPEKQKKAQETMDSLEAIKNLISKEVLKTMQLLGFNYKAAIGEPLTELCANAIRNLGNGKRNTTNGGNRKNNR